MKSGLKTIFAFALALAVGCATVKISDSVGNVKVENGATPIESVDVTNMAWYFLACLPIASGDTDNPNGHTCKWFSDTTDVEHQLKMLQDEADRVGAKRAENVTTITYDEDFFLFVFVRTKIHTSAVLVK